MVGDEAISVNKVIPQFINVYYPDGRVAFRYDPARGIVELQDRRIKHWFDLTQVIVNKPVDQAQPVCYDMRQ